MSPEYRAALVDLVKHLERARYAAGLALANSGDSIHLENLSWAVRQLGKAESAIQAVASMTGVIP